MSVHKRPGRARSDVEVAMRPGKRNQLNPFIERDFVAKRIDAQVANMSEEE